MRFTKMHGLGNDFVVFDGSTRPTLTPESISALCDRRRGVGADGVLVVTPIDPTTIRMEYWNADGTPAEMCGNGLRCSAWFAHDRGWVDAPAFTVETARGPLEASIVGERVVRVGLGGVAVGASLRLRGTEMITASVGNPHAVIGVEVVETAPVEELGPALSTDAEFAEGANIGFMAVTDAGIDLRVWERGVGETLACGSGAAAAAAVAIAAGRVQSPVSVRLPGGTLVVEVEDGEAYLTGPVEVSFSGTLAP